MTGTELLIVGLLLLLVRILHLASQAESPTLYFKQTKFHADVLSYCTLLAEAYVPPLLWGKSGHIQTIIYGKLGRMNTPYPQGERKQVLMEDGSTVSYDIFEPYEQSNDDCTLLFCPGIANSSEAAYIRTAVHYAQLHGYRVSVLNHLGALKTEPLTGHRMFNYGSTEEFDLMVSGIKNSFPDSKCIAVGFSMGGNILCKWLAEKIENQDKVLAAMSFCQGYNAGECVPHLMRWDHLRRGYLFAMTLHQRALLRRHEDKLLGKEAGELFGPFDKKKIFEATSLLEIDRYYTSQRLGFGDVMEYYDWSSCAPMLENIDIPLFILNAMDDPIVPNSMHKYPRELASKKDNVMFATTAHGGHLGYFETKTDGKLLLPDTITWIDKLIVQYADAVLKIKKEESSENGFHPTENGFHPSGNGFHPTENGFHPSGNGFHPTENGFHPSGNGFHPSGNGFHPKPCGDQK